MKYFVETPEVWITEFLEQDDNCDGYWISSLTQSWQKGYADNCTLSWSNYVDLVRRLRFHTDKQIVVDVDMMFNEPSIAATISRELYAVGCDTIVVESKRFPKVNSLTPNSMVLSTPDEFCRLLNKVKTTCPELELIARIEYLAQTRSIETTVEISKRAIDSGADGVVVHWGGDADTELLKGTLQELKQAGIQTGIIPTKYLDQVVAGEFNELADFSILGNICSSFIRHSFGAQSVSSLLETPCMFEPILDRVGSHEPPGHKALVVLGARPDSNGENKLASRAVIERFMQQADDYYRIVFVVGDGVEVPLSAKESVTVVHIENSLGELDSLIAARNSMNTEHTTVVYADLDDVGFDNISAPGLAFYRDLYCGVLNIKTELLLSMMSASDPSETILDMASRHSVSISSIQEA